MCLLVNQPKETSFTDDFLANVYSKNRDGFGVMYAEDDKVHVYKCLPANKEDFIAFYRAHADGRDCIWHARMQTHGDIDMENCHPYKVTDDIWLAHNGVLSTSNDGDASKSDTWHFIRNVMRPALTADPDLMLDPDWLRFIGRLIGSSNKFGLVRSDGEMSVINEASGVKFVGAWLSNTYAWTPSMFGFKDTTVRNYTYNNYYQGHWADDDEKYDAWLTSKYEDSQKLNGAPKQQSLLEYDRKVVEVERKPSESQIKNYVKAAYNSYTRQGPAALERWVFDAPHKASAVLAAWYTEYDGVEDLPYKDPEEAALWIAELIDTDVITPSWLT